jgi:hypothetical protein
MVATTRGSSVKFWPGENKWKFVQLVAGENRIINLFCDLEKIGHLAQNMIKYNNAWNCP